MAQIHPSDAMALRMRFILRPSNRPDAFADIGQARMACTEFPKVAHTRDIPRSAPSPYADLPLADTTGKKAGKGGSRSAAAGFVLLSGSSCSRQGRLEFMRDRPF